jgi:hypothetical protein
MISWTIYGDAWLKKGRFSWIWSAFLWTPNYVLSDDGPCRLLLPPCDLGGRHNMSWWLGTGSQCHQTHYLVQEKRDDGRGCHTCASNHKSIMSRYFLSIAQPYVPPWKWVVLWSYRVSPLVANVEIDPMFSPRYKPHTNGWVKLGETHSWFFLM